jgi:hypothetical protein
MNNSGDLSLRSLFDHPTAQEMAAEIERLILAKLAVLSEGPVLVTPNGAGA